MLGRLLKAIRSPARAAHPPPPPANIACGGTGSDEEPRPAHDIPATAVDALAGAHAERPADPELANRYALALEAAQRFDLAEEVYRTSLAVNPGNRTLLNNLSNLLMRARGIDAAAPVFEAAIRAHPQDAVLLYNFAVNCAAANRTEQAIALYRQALANDPAMGPAAMNLALLLFQGGEFVEGGLLFERRWSVAPELRGDYRLDPGRQWRGEPLAGKSILLWAEQGLGDSLLMIRYVPLVHARGAAGIHLRVPRALFRLCAGMPGVAKLEIEEECADGSDADVHCPLMSLPLAFATGPTTIPAPIPYLYADKSLVEPWEQRLPPRNGALRVGLVWSSSQWGANADLNHRRQKSIPLAQLAPLLALPGIAWTSLQLGAGKDEVGQIPSRLRPFDPTDDVADFADTAAIIGQLDLVLSVDTSVAHLAGAMGKPVLMPLRYTGAMYWPPGRDDSPWYPGVMRILRQESAGDWNPVIAQAERQLRHFALHGTFRDEP